MPKIYLFMLIFFPFNTYSEDNTDDQQIITITSNELSAFSVPKSQSLITFEQLNLLDAFEIEFYHNALKGERNNRSLLLIKTTTESANSTKKYCCYWGEIGVEPGFIILLSILTVSYLAYLYSQGIP